MTASAVEAKTCRLVQVAQAGKEFQGKQGLSYAPGISAESVGALGIHLQIVTIPPEAEPKRTNTRATKPRSTC